MLTLPCPDFASYLALPGDVTVNGMTLHKRGFSPDNKTVLYTL